MAILTDLQQSTGVIRRWFLKIDGLKDILWQDVNPPDEDAEPVDCGPPGAHSITNDCLACWRFDEWGNGANAVDSSPNGFTGTSNGNPEVTSGQIGNARQVGNGKYFAVTPTTKLHTQRLTISTWIYVSTTSQQSGATAIYQRRDSANSYSWKLSVTGSTSRIGLRLYFSDATTLDTYIASGMAVGWHHICATWDGTNARVYIDGVLTATGTDSGSKSILYSTDASAKLYIGSDADTATAYWSSRIDDTAIYNTVKSAEWIKRTYDGGYGYSRPGLNCLTVSAESSDQLNLGDMTSGLSAMSFGLLNVKDPSAPTTHLFAKLFAPGRWSTSLHTWLRRTTADSEGRWTYLDANATEVTVQSLDGWPTSGEAHIGQEVFAYSGTTTAALTTGETGGQFTGVTKGLYPCVGNKTQYWGKTYRHSLDESIAGDATFIQTVSDVPYSWVGRRCALYLTCWDRVNRRWYNESEALLIWVGTVNGKISYDPADDSWRLDCESIFALLDKPVLAEQPSQTLYDVINLGGPRALSYRVTEYDHEGKAAAQSTFTLAAGQYDHPALMKLVNNAFAALVPSTSGFSGTSSWPTTPLAIQRMTDNGELRYRLEGFKSTVGSPQRGGRYDIACSTQGETPFALLGLGLPVNDAGIVRVTLDGNRPDGTDTGNGTYGFVDGEEPYEALQPVHIKYNGGTLWTNGLGIQGGWASQGDYGSTRAFLITSKTKLQAMDWGDIEQRRLFVVTDKLTHRYTLADAASIMNEREHGGWIGRRTSENPIELSYCYVMESHSAALNRTRGPFELLLYSLLSTGTSGYGNALWDALPMELGVGMQPDLIDTQSFLEMDRVVMSLSPDLARRQPYVITKSTSWRDLFQREAKLFGCFLAWSRGKLRVKSAWAVEENTQVIDLNESNSAQWNDWPVVELSSATVVNQWECKVDYDFSTDKYGAPITIVDVDSQQGMGGLAKIVRIEHQGVRIRDLTAGIRSLLEQTFRKAHAIVRYPWQRLTVTLAPTLMGRVYVGDIVTYNSNHRHPDPFGSGAMSVSATGIILDANWDLTTFTGRATILLFSGFDTAAIRPWAASALVDIEANNGGYNAAGRHLVLVPVKYGEVGGDPDDGTRFVSGDVVHVIARSPIDPTSLLAHEGFFDLTVDADYEANGAEFLTLAAGSNLVDWNANAEYIVVPADYGSATATQRLQNAYQANVAAKLPGAAAAHRWG